MFKMFRILLVVSLLLVGTFPALAQGNGEQLAYGDSALGEITQDVYELFYTFEGNADDVIVISMTKLQEGLDPYLDLLGPDGTSLMQDDDSGGNLNSLLGPFTLPTSGTYTIVATRFMRETGGSTGAFRLTLQLAETTPLTVDATVTVELNDETPNAFFSVSGAPDVIYSLAGQGLGGNVDFTLSVRDPFGNHVNSWYSTANDTALLDPLALTMDGDYMIVVTRQPQVPAGSSAESVVRIDLTLHTITTAPLSFDEAYSGMLSDANPSEHFTFEGERGDMLRLAGSGPRDQMSFEVQLIAPEGYVFSGGGPAYQGPEQTEFVVDPIILESTGQFMAVVRRINTTGLADLSGTVDFTFTLSRTQTPILVPGEMVTDTINQPNMYVGVNEQVYRFEGAEGVPIRITISSLDEGYAPGMDVQGPQPETPPGTGGIGYGGGGSVIVAGINSAVPGTVTYEVTLPTTGVYLFRVRNGIFMYGPGPADTGTPEEAGGSYSLLVEVID